MTAAIAQPRFAGVVKIVRLNVRFYVLSGFCLAAVAGLLAWRRMPPGLEIAVLCGAAVVAFWTVSSLVVSWYIYDHAGVTRWRWLPERMPVVPHRWANIHAGLDESTAALRLLFPGSQGSAIDIYESGEMTEPSIARARKLHASAEPFQSGRYDALPIADQDCDAVFILFAAHEVREADHRTQLLRESARVLRDQGGVVLVEHLRDWANFIAFGPGFLHFHSKRSWLRNIREAGLLVQQESRVTSFVHCFLLRKDVR